MRVEEADELSWLLRERATGREWRVETSEMAWKAGGYDPGRFEVHVTDERVSGAPDGYPEPVSFSAPTRFGPAGSASNMEVRRAEAARDLSSTG